MSVLKSFIAMLRPAKRAVRDVGAAEAKRMQDAGALVLDVREKFEYDRGHVPGAKLVPLGDVDALAGDLPKDRPIVVHCALGTRSRKAASTLAEKGYDVVHIGGGFSEWKSAGLPVEREAK